MVRTRYAPDRGLQARMGLTMFLLGVVFVALVVALVFIMAAFKLGAGAIIFFAVLLGAGLTFGSLFWSDKVALRASGAREVTPAEAPQLHGIIDRICALADMPKPRVAVAQSNMPNAFATGRNSKSAVVVVTTGLMAKLNDQELEGVLAHELSHIAHKDVVVMTVASFLGIVTYAISFLLIRLLSRYRELAADRAGALLTGQPSALASALTKVSDSMSAIPTKDLREAQALTAFYFAPAIKPNTQSLSTIFSTHPSLERRLRQLDEISKQLGR